MHGTGWWEDGWGVAVWVCCGACGADARGIVGTYDDERWCVPGGTVCVGCTWMNEFLAPRGQAAATTLLNAMDGSVMVTQSLYYAVDRDWFPLHAFGLAYACVMVVAALAIPESPKWCYATKRYDRARASLRVISKFNRTDQAVFDGTKFDTEAAGEAGVAQEGEYSKLQVTEADLKFEVLGTAI